MYNQREAEFKDLENSQPGQIVKNKKVFSEKKNKTKQNTKDVDNQTFDKEISVGRKKIGAIHQDDGRMILKAFLRPLWLSHPHRPRRPEP